MAISSRISKALRRLSANFRSMPGCLIIGAQKAGTSSLAHYLKQQSACIMATKKEIHYFDSGAGLYADLDTYTLGQQWYRSHFPLSRHITNKMTFEATPMYLFHPLAAQRIKLDIPDAKLIILLRDPIKRAISHYHHVVRHGFEDLPLLEALKAEENRLESVWRNQTYQSAEFRLYSYKARGLYYQQIKRYLQYFDNEQLLILDSDELFSSAESVLQEVFNFLELPEPTPLRDIGAQNVGQYDAEISKEVIEYLADYFNQPNQKLFELLGKNYNW